MTRVRQDLRASNQSYDPNGQFKYKQHKSFHSKQYDPLLPFKFEERYKFDFSTQKDLAGDPSKCRITTIVLLLLATLFLPVAILIDAKDDHVDWDFPWNSWLVYVLIFNTTFLMVGGAYIVSTAAYPYSNSILVHRLTKQSNRRFGLEFSRCIDRMTRMIKDSTENQNSERASTIMDGTDEAIDLNDKKTNAQFLSSRDIYMRVAQNLELIELYYKVNQKIIDKTPNQSNLFIQTTHCLLDLKRILDKIQVQITFRHPWFSGKEVVSFWAFFNKFNLETEKKEEVANVKKFFVKYSSPVIPQTESNLRNLALLIQASADFTRCIQQSVQQCCGICRSSQILFGRSDQAVQILNQSFEGQQFIVDGPSNHQIDCMFFPCTQKEKVIVFSETDEEAPQKVAEYIYKPTIIMCNPNALFYQQMVNAANAYWLNFFLKRDCNVMCWNYRGYGESKKGWFDTLNPTTSKRDAERVLAFIVNKLQIKGKIGVYGRSIGGIAACHLAAKFNDLVEVLVVDRTLDELQGVAAHRLKGKATTKMFDLYMNGWKCENAVNFLKAGDCFKIITCDPLDDTIDQFNCLVAGVASQKAEENYETDEYRLFHESLIYVCEYEEKFYAVLTESQRDDLPKLILETVKGIENELTEFQPKGLIDSSREGPGFRMSFIQQREATIATESPFFVLLHALQVMLCELSGGVMMMRDVLGITRVPSFREFTLFLKSLEVYGCGYQDDVDYLKYSLRQKQTHQETAIIQLEALLKMYAMLLHTMEHQQEQLPTYHSQFVKFVTFQMQMFTKLLEIQKGYIIDQDEGHLVQFSCGHRGQPSRIEEKRVSRLLRKSGFIPMLDEISNKDATLVRQSQRGSVTALTSQLLAVPEEEPFALIQKNSTHVTGEEDSFNMSHREASLPSFSQKDERVSQSVKAPTRLSVTRSPKGADRTKSQARFNDFDEDDVE